MTSAPKSASCEDDRVAGDEPRHVDHPDAVERTRGIGLERFLRHAHGPVGSSGRRAAPSPPPQRKKTRRRRRSMTPRERLRPGGATSRIDGRRRSGLANEAARGAPAGRARLVEVEAALQRAGLRAASSPAARPRPRRAPRRPGRRSRRPSAAACRGVRSAGRMNTRGSGWSRRRRRPRRSRHAALDIGAQPLGKRSSSAR